VCGGIDRFEIELVGRRVVIAGPGAAFDHAALHLGRAVGDADARLARAQALQARDEVRACVLAQPSPVTNTSRTSGRRAPSCSARSSSLRTHEGTPQGIVARGRWPLAAPP